MALNIYNSVMLDWRLLRALLVKDLRARYRPTLLGYWADLALSGAAVLVYAGAFGALGVKLPPGSWPVFLAGAASWQWTAGVIGAAPSLYGRNARLLRRFSPRWTEHVLAGVLCEAAPAAGLLAVGLLGAAAHGLLDASWLLLPLFAAAQAAVLTGWGSLAAAAGVPLRDVQRLSGPASKALFFFTPVAFDPAVLPAALAAWLPANPAAVFVQSWRAALTGAPLGWTALGLHSVFGLLLAAAAARASSRLAEYS